MYLRLAAQFETILLQLGCQRPEDKVDYTAAFRDFRPWMRSERDGSSKALTGELGMHLTQVAATGFGFPPSVTRRPPSDSFRKPCRLLVIPGRG